MCIYVAHVPYISNILQQALANCNIQTPLYVKCMYVAILMVVILQEWLSVEWGMKVLLGTVQFDVMVFVLAHH